MTYILKKTTDFSPKEDVDFIENLYPTSMPEIHYDIEEKIERAPHLREKFRYEARERNEYVPKRQLHLTSTSSNIENDGYKKDKYEEMISNLMDKISNLQNGFTPSLNNNTVNNISPQKAHLIKTDIDPDKIFNDPDGKNKRYYIMNTRDNSVFISIGNKEENSFRIDTFQSLQSVPDNFYNYSGFRECFYGNSPALIFITEEQYRKRKEIVVAMRERERQIADEIAARAQERGGHAHGRDQNAYGDPHESYSSMRGQVGGQVIDGVYFYGQGETPLPSRGNSISEEINVEGALSEYGITDILKMAQSKEHSVTTEEGLISTEELNQYMKNL